jgi:heme exporter protein B
MRAFLSLIGRDLRLALAHGGDGLGVLAFFVIAASLFPFGLGPDEATLARLAPGLVWVIALMAAFLGADRLFHADAEDGTLDLLALGPLPLAAVVGARVLALWLVTGLPLVLLAPLIGAMLALDGAGLLPLALSMLLGTPTLLLVGAVGAALTVGARRAGVLLGLIVLPLYIPVLIFGVAAVEAAVTGEAPWPFLEILGALLLIALPLAPLAAAAAIRQTL